MNGCALVLVLLLALGCSPPWRGRAAFLAKLRCGMTEAELATLVRQEGVEEFTETRIHAEPVPGPHYYLSKGNTLVSFQFDHGRRLVWYAVAFTDSNDSDNSRRVPLCAGQTALPLRTRPEPVELSR
jgi:hypothetical protein